MKWIIAVIRPEKIAAVVEGLARLGIDQLTLTDVCGVGHEPGKTLCYRGASVTDPRRKRIKLELAVEEEYVDRAVEAIHREAKTGAVGDGVIMAAPLETFFHIRQQPPRKGNPHVAQMGSLAWDHTPSDVVPQGL